MADKTTNYQFTKPADDDFYDIQVENQNWDKADAELKKMSDEKLDKTGDASNISSSFTKAADRENLVSKERLSTSLGKMAKWFEDTKEIAFTGKAADLTDDASHRLVTDTEKNVWNGKVSAAGGDVSETNITSMDTVETEFPVPAAGDTMRGFAGKVKKFISDFNDFKSGIITVGKLANNFSTTASGYALDARAGKELREMVTQLNSDYGQLNTNLTSINLTNNTFSTQADFDKFIDNHCNLSDRYRCKIECHFVPAAFKAGGFYIIEGYKEINGYGWQKAICYWGDEFYRECRAGTWASWKAYIFNSDFQPTSSWTPIITADNNDANISYIIQRGTYAKSGNIVTISCKLTMPASEFAKTSGRLRIVSFPVAASLSSNDVDVPIMLYYSEAVHIGFLRLYDGMRTFALQKPDANNYYASDFSDLAGNLEIKILMTYPCK